MSMVDVTLTVNGVQYTAQAEPRRTLADFLRHDLGLTGTHIGCEHGVCGACTVNVNGAAVRSCLMLAVQAQDWKVRTIEGLAKDGVLSPLQSAFRESHGLQCGFCTPGILMTADALLASEPHASDERILEVLSGHICRCTGYFPIVEAIVSARNALADIAKAGSR
jgi:aerobic-type carbon monoxide dehydrogenase small subunit (CoxS/CutS family)